MANAKSTQSCNLDLLPQSKVPNPTWDWRNTQRLAASPEMLLGSISFQRKSRLDGCERPQRKKRPSKKRFGYLLGHLSFWVSGMESPFIFLYTKIKKKKKKERINTNYNIHD